MTLFSLYYGKSKKKIKTLLMTDSYKKCENYMNARHVRGFHEIRLAEKGATTYRKKSCTVGFLQSLQYLHDNYKNWNEKGLSKLGKEKYQRIKNEWCSKASKTKTIP